MEWREADVFWISEQVSPDGKVWWPRREVAFEGGWVHVREREEERQYPETVSYPASRIASVKWHDETAEPSVR